MDRTERAALSCPAEGIFLKYRKYYKINSKERKYYIPQGEKLSYTPKIESITYPKERKYYIPQGEKLSYTSSRERRPALSSTDVNDSMSFVLPTGSIPLLMISCIQSHALSRMRGLDINRRSTVTNLPQ